MKAPLHATVPCVTINSTQVTASAGSQGEQREGVRKQRGINGWCQFAFVPPARLSNIHPFCLVIDPLTNNTGERNPREKNGVKLRGLFEFTAGQVEVKREAFQMQTFSKVLRHRTNTLFVHDFFYLFYFFLCLTQDASYT